MTNATFLPLRTKPPSVCRRVGRPATSTTGVASRPGVRARSFFSSLELAPEGKNRGKLAHGKQNPGEQTKVLRRLAQEGQVATLSCMLQRSSPSEAAPPGVAGSRANQGVYRRCLSRAVPRGAEARGGPPEALCCRAAKSCQYCMIGSAGNWDSGIQHVWSGPHPDQVTRYSLNT